jgi:hypothetical protein
MTSGENGTQSGLIPPHGGYRNLVSFQGAEIIMCDATSVFCGRFMDRLLRRRNSVVINCNQLKDGGQVVTNCTG